MITARTDKAADLHDTGEALLDQFEALHAQYKNQTVSDLATTPDQFTDIESRLPDGCQSQEDMADWRVFIDPENPPQLREWVQPATAPDQSAISAAVAAFDALLELDMDTITVEGLWVPYRKASDAKYKLNIVADTPSFGEQRYQASIGVDTGGRVDCRLALHTPEEPTPVPIFDMPIASPSDAETQPFAEEISRAREENWARAVVGSHARHIARQTALSYTETLVHLLDGLDKTTTDADIAELLGRSRSSVATQKQRVREKYDNAPMQIEKQQRTLEVVDASPKELLVDE